MSTPKGTPRGGGQARRRAPRAIADALASLTPSLAPATALARVQEVWPSAAGPAIAAAARPVAEHDGVLDVACEAAVWAAELDLLAGEIVPRINAELGVETVRELRCRTG
jgi:predicted nucleic acid-binding Zn ribbon protein